MGPPDNPQYYGEYVRLGAWTVIFIITLPVGVPLAIIGWGTERVVDWVVERQVENRT